MARQTASAMSLKFENLHFLFTFSPPPLLQVFCKKRRATRKAMFDGGEGNRNIKCINTLNMHCCRVRRAAERGNGSMKISERMLQHDVTRGKTLPLHP